MARETNWLAGCPMRNYNNPFQKEELRYPKQYETDIQAYCKTRSSQPITYSPFPRIVDFWFLSFCMGVQQSVRVPISRDNTVKFVEGTIFTSDPWRIQILTMFAIGFKNDAKIIGKPREIIQIANEFAAGGMDFVLEMLKGNSNAMNNICTELDEILRN